MDKFSAQWFVVGLGIGMIFIVTLMFSSLKAQTPHKAYLIYEQKALEWDNRFQKEVDQYHNQWHKDKDSRERTYLKDRYGK